MRSWVQVYCVAFSHNRTGGRGRRLHQETYAEPKVANYLSAGVRGAIQPCGLAMNRAHYGTL